MNINQPPTSTASSKVNEIFSFGSRIFVAYEERGECDALCLGTRKSREQVIDGSPCTGERITPASSVYRSPINICDSFSHLQPSIHSKADKHYCYQAPYDIVAIHYGAGSDFLAASSFALLPAELPKKNPTIIEAMLMIAILISEISFGASACLNTILESQHR